jgi:cell division protein FtsB
VGPGNTVIHWARSKSELRHQKKQVELYQKEIEQMRRQVEMLQNNRDSLEKFAREQFMFSAPGEDVFIVE